MSMMESKLAEALREGLEIQRANYGDGMRTHIALIGWKDKWQDLLVAYDALPVSADDIYDCWRRLSIGDPDVGDADRVRNWMESTERRAEIAEVQLAAALALQQDTTA